MSAKPSSKSPHRRNRPPEKRAARPPIASPPRHRGRPSLPRWLPYVVAALVVIVVGLLALRPWDSPTAQASPGQFFASQGHCHIGVECPEPAAFYDAGKFQYSSDPPTSGPHREEFPPNLINDTPLTKPQVVHMQEHANIVLFHGDRATPDEVKQLQDIARSFDRNPQQSASMKQESGEAVLTTPWPGLKTKFAIAAWTRLDAFDELDRARIDRFVNAWRGNAQNASQ